MDIHTNIPLKNYTTMKLGGPARFMTTLSRPEDIPTLYQNAAQQGVPIFILGGGSNTIVRDEGFNGIVARMQIPGFSVASEDASSVTIRIGAGENWDEVVKRTVEMNLSGIEAMSAIPGTAGAAPVQNVGAYGQEVAETLTELDAYDSQSGQFVTLAGSDCGFSYRHSIFRGDQAGRYVITAISLKLSKNPPQPPFYKAVQDYLDAQSITIVTPQTIRDAVIAIRADKLPDPTLHPNTGSFFKNALVDDWLLKEIEAENEGTTVPHYDMPDGRFKVPTGWLIEQTGLKGTVIAGMKVHDKNALVLINESATSYADLAQARDEIQTAVRTKFRIEIEQEPLELGPL